MGGNSQIAGTGGNLKIDPWIKMAYSGVFACSLIFQNVLHIIQVNTQPGLQT